MTTATRVLVGQGAQLTFTAYDDGTQTDLGTVTIGIVDGNGTTVVAAGTSVTDNSDGTYEYVLAKQTSVGFLTATWSVTGGADFTTYVEVVGSQLFNEAQLRAFDNSALTDATKYPDAEIAATHDRVADYLEHATGRSFIRRYCRTRLAGSGNRCLYLSDGIPLLSSGYPLNRPAAGTDIIRVISATDGTTKTVSDIDIQSDQLALTTGVWASSTTADPFNVVVEYEYGLPYPDGAADRIAMMIAQQWLTSSRIPSSAASFTDPLGSYTFDETRLPFEAYQWIKAHRTPVFFG